MHLHCSWTRMHIMWRNGFEPWVSRAFYGSKCRLFHTPPATWSQPCEALQAASVRLATCAGVLPWSDRLTLNAGAPVACVLEAGRRKRRARMGGSTLRPGTRGLARNRSCRVALQRAFLRRRQVGLRSERQVPAVRLVLQLPFHCLVLGGTSVTVSPSLALVSRVCYKRALGTIVKFIGETRPIIMN